MELITKADWFTITPTGLTINSEFSEDDWKELGSELARNSRSLMWLIGDWLLAGEGAGYLPDGKLDAACDVFKIEYQTAKNAKWVASKFERSLRKDLPWHHHLNVAGRPDAQELLDWAIETKASVKDLRQEKNRRAVVEPAPIPDTFNVVDSLDNLGQFGTIYADPPWQYGNQATRASTDNHYSTMSVDDICEMPIAEHAADDAHLHLWTTNAFLFDAKRVMDAWGFEYRSVFVWVKPQMGIGNYWRVSHEFLLLGIRGSAKRFNERNHMSWGEFDRGRHSAKPEQIRSVIQRVSPGPFLELFGRKPVQGWTVFGNQIDKGLFSECADGTALQV